MPGHPAAFHDSARLIFRSLHVQEYLAHKKLPPTLGPP